MLLFSFSGMERNQDQDDSESKPAVCPTGFVCCRDTVGFPARRDPLFLGDLPSMQKNKSRRNRTWASSVTRPRGRVASTFPLLGITGGSEPLQEMRLWLRGEGGGLPPHACAACGSRGLPCQRSLPAGSREVGRVRLSTDSFGPWGGVKVAVKIGVCVLAKG
ncbi:hypothetical protein LZ30DRAFT_323257 [Colletotrichum cereale]|nr:hypothetical protein LZ30DRAFT_323257 [Colletotrichum cereale]